MKSIILTGGGTAGHFTPLLALLPELRKRFDEVHFAGRGAGVERELAEGTGMIYHALGGPRLERGKVFRNLGVPFALMRAVKNARRLLDEIRPDVVFSKGGYVALPIALACKRVPLVIHESDTSLGLANRLSARRAVAICSSFPLPRAGGKDVLRTGSPLRAGLYAGDRKRALAACGFSGKKKVLLVTGGSLGAEAIARAVERNADALTERYDVIHLCGRGKALRPRAGYAPVGFTTSVADYFAAADLALTRAGGNTLFELGALGVPMLIVPLPKGASRGDQVENAAFFSGRGLALELDQSELDGGLLPALRRLERAAPDLIAAMSKYPFDGTDAVLDVIYRAAERAGSPQNACNGAAL